MNVDYVLHGDQSPADDRTTAKEHNQQPSDTGAMRCTLTINQPALVLPATACLSKLQLLARGTNAAIVVSNVRRGGSTITFTLARQGDPRATDTHGRQSKAVQQRAALMVLRSVLEAHWRDHCNRRVVRSSTTWAS